MSATRRWLKHACIGGLLGCAALNARATDTTLPDPAIPYYAWYEVVLPESSGASCGNGTPLRFYVNRAQSDNMLYMMQPGGACWNYATCSETATSGPEAGLGAFNHDGIPHNYMNGTASQSRLPSRRGSDGPRPKRPSTTKRPVRDARTTSAHSADASSPSSAPAAERPATTAPSVDACSPPSSSSQHE